MKIYDIAVIGAGPAGCMAAIQGAKNGKDVILMETNDKIGRKLLLTAQGRCNFTNEASLEVFMEKFGKRGSFYRDAFTRFSNHDLMNFFKGHGLEIKEEEDGRIFPITEKSEDVINVLKRVLDEYGVKILYNYRLKHLNKQSNVFKLSQAEGNLIAAHNVIIATGGVSYGYTGSTGDGLAIAESLGHHISKLIPGGIPLRVKDEWVYKLKGVTLENVGLSIRYAGNIISLPRGNLLLTHFGVSGPVILDMSDTIIEIMDKYGEVKLLIDFKPEVKEEDLEVQLIEDFQSKKTLRNYLKNHLIERMIDPVLHIIHLDPHKRLNQITKKERVHLVKTFKALPLTITGHLPLDNAMITCGGVTKKEIDPRTMESKLVKGLYFAGEIIEGCGRKGGYNLQQAFSTGFLAGSSANCTMN
ncbi:MAG: NAD(P)/FAD-dependent oxidoreductase [Methanobacterium sp.]